MIAFDDRYVTNSGPYSVELCPYCGGYDDCGTGHRAPIRREHVNAYRLYQVVSNHESSMIALPEEKKHFFRASALGRRYIPVALDLAALPFVVVQKPWMIPSSPMRPVRTRGRARPRSVAPLRSRPGGGRRPSPSG